MYPDMLSRLCDFRYKTQTRQTQYKHLNVMKKIRKERPTLEWVDMITASDISLYNSFFFFHFCFDLWWYPGIPRNYFYSVFRDHYWWSLGNHIRCLELGYGDQTLVCPGQVQARQTPYSSHVDNCDLKDCFRSIPYHHWNMVSDCSFQWHGLKGQNQSGSRNN